MKRRVEKIEMDCQECDGLGLLAGSYGHDGEPEKGCWHITGQVVRDCPVCQGSGKVLDFPPEPEFEIEERN
jgi:hypothetical protein